MNDEQRILTSILGVTDAIFTPNRDWTRPRPVNVYELRQQYRDVGVAWASGAVGDAAQKQASRLLADLASRGQVEVVRRGGEVRFVKLADATDDATRHLCFLPTCAESWPLLEKLAERPDGHWIPETEMNCGRGWGDAHGDELGWVQSQLAPFLCRGLVTSNATTQRHVCYCLSKLGREALATGKPPAVPKDAAWSAEGSEFYWQSWSESKAKLTTRKPTNPSEIGEIPLSMSALAPVNEGAR